LPIKKDSLFEFREVYQATASKRAKYPSTNVNRIVGDIKWISYFEVSEIYSPFTAIYVNMRVQSLAVFCGSKKGNNELYTEHASRLGKLLAENKIRLIYGGGSVGIMGSIADAVLEHGGHVTGIIPKLLLEWEVQHQHITELIVSDDMHLRKKSLYEMCDAALILPGGFGTLDELFEIVTWNQLSIHDKKIYILNTGGFYDHLISHIQKMRDEGFLYEKPEHRIVIANEPEQLINYLL
jgi:uncharacterized protein (TIGR00730 family)